MDENFVTNFINALYNKFEKISNKVNNISGNFDTDNSSYPTVKSVKSFFGNKVTSWSNNPSDNNYPSERLVKDTFDTKLNISDAVETSDITSSIASHNTNSSAHSVTLNALRNDIMSSVGQIYEEKENKVIALSGASTDNQYPSAKLLYDELQLKQNISSAFSGDYTDLTNQPSIPERTSDLVNDGDGENAFLTEHQSLESMAITVEQQQDPDIGFASTYVIKQNGSQVGPKINIPKDFLLKSADSHIVGQEPTELEEEYELTEGDIYLDFVINTQEDDGTDKHLIIPFSNYIEIYTADESTLTVSNNEFSVKQNGITINELASSIVTSLGYADAFNNSPCKDITLQDINNWNDSASNNITEDVVETIVEDYLSEIITKLNENEGEIE